MESQRQEHVVATRQLRLTLAEESLSEGQGGRGCRVRSKQAGGLMCIQKGWRWLRISSHEGELLGQAPPRMCLAGPSTCIQFGTMSGHMCSLNAMKCRANARFRGFWPCSSLRELAVAVCSSTTGFCSPQLWQLHMSTRLRCTSSLMEILNRSP